VTALVHHAERCPENQKLKALVAWWEKHGPFPIVIAYGNRTDAEQWALYQQGRTRPGRVVTNAKSAAESAHGHTGAIDCFPVRDLFPLGGVRTVYLGDEEDHIVRAQAVARLNVYVSIVKQFGLESGADFPGLHDLPHAQDPEWPSRPVVI
jgi:peptidoglycan L-alanyl-D-glutamate endopeptidase CwlK